MRKKLLSEVVLSDKWKFRFCRHILFWAAVYLYHFIRVSIIFPVDKLWINIPKILVMSFFWGVCFNIYFTCIFAYYVIPKFFTQKKYFRFAIAAILLFLSMEILGIVYNYLNISGSVNIFIGIPLIKNNFAEYRGGIIRLMGNPPLICGFFVALKAMKNWYKEQLQNELLAKENANAELQLLKAQVHPHFLFNTLNNIYSLTLSKSPEASSLVSKLSDTMQYMITDCKTDLVPLEKELKMLEDYMSLEKVRYGDRLEMWMDINGDYKNKLIAPLIMIPFVENCFKHGSSAMRGKQWIQLSIHIKENTLQFLLRNSKPPEPVQIKNKKGIGLTNVKKRLALLYPNHQLDISSAEGVFSVNLQLELQTVKDEKKETINKYLETTL